MNSKQRLLKAFEGGKLDHLPVTTHHVMPYFLNKFMRGISADDFFDAMGMDHILWKIAHKPDTGKGEYYDSIQDEPGFLEARRVCSDSWRFEMQDIPDDSYTTARYNIVTPKATLTTVLQSNAYTTWVAEHLIKKKQDIELIAEFMTTPACDVNAVNNAANAYGDMGIVRGHIPCFDLFGQPGCWQDACCIVGTQDMIMHTYDDPEWVHELLTILMRRKVAFANSLKGAKYDILELGGGDASTTIISPKIFQDFVAPYDTQVIAAAHDSGQRIVYHTCGGMMPILNDIADMNPDAMETFTPPGMGGDVDLAEAKRQIGDRVCMIGGFDQGKYFIGCSEAETRQAVRDCFEAAGQGGGFVLAPSDHFFDADPALIKAFADEASKCRY